MKKAHALFGSAVFLIIAPGVVAGYVPWLVTGWERAGPFSALHAVGIGFIVIGAAGLGEAFLRFALDGRGTPAPVAPPETLVVSGPYRFVRNPMYVSVIALIVGQALLFDSVPLAGYAAAVWLFFHLFVTLYEEPRLARQFGDDYAEYCAHVRRWLPRLRPWRRVNAIGSDNKPKMHRSTR